MIRLLNIDELPLLLEGGREFFAEGKMPGGFDEEHFLTTLEGFMQAENAYVAGSFGADGEIHGALGWIIHPGIFSPVVVAQELFWFVRPAFRGRIGEAVHLLKFFEASARAQGAVRVAMIHLVNLNQEKLGAFYERSGYTLIENHFEKEMK